MKTLLPFSLIILLLGLVISQYSFAQSDDVDFNFYWTSGDLIEVVAKAPFSGQIKVKFIDFPQDYEEKTQDFFVDKLKIIASTDCKLDKGYRLYVINEWPKFSKEDTLKAKDYIILTSSKPNQVFVDTFKINSLPIRDDFFIIAMKDNILYKMKVCLSLNTKVPIDTTIKSKVPKLDVLLKTSIPKIDIILKGESLQSDTLLIGKIAERDTVFRTTLPEKESTFKIKKDSLKNVSLTSTKTVSRLRVLRYLYKDKLFTYLEDENTNIIDVITPNFQNEVLPKSVLEGIADISALDSVKITIDTTQKVENLQIYDYRGKFYYADTIEVKSLLPSKIKHFSIAFDNPKYESYESPWYTLNVNPQGASNFILLDQFKLISNGGRIKIKYHKLGGNKIQEKSGIVLERYFLGLELGSVYNAGIDGSPIGKLEYSLQGSAIFGRNPIDFWNFSGGMLEGSALVRYTWMRFPAELSQDSLALLGNIVESKIQLAWSPAQREWETSKFSLVTCLLAKTNNLNDSSNVIIYPGFGLGINIRIPSFNEKRPKEEFGRSTGFFSLYYAYDSFWKEYEDRIVSDFRIDIFRILSNSITFSINGKLDASLKFEGPSDIRLSFLGAINVSTISGFISGGK